MDRGARRFWETDTWRFALGFVWGVLLAIWLLRTGFRIATVTNRVEVFQLGAGVGFVLLFVLTALSHLVHEGPRFVYRFAFVSFAYVIVGAVVYLFTRGDARPELFLFAMSGGFCAGAAIWSVTTLVRRTLSA